MSDDIIDMCSAPWARRKLIPRSKCHVCVRLHSCASGFRNEDHAPPRDRHLLHSAKCPTTLSTCARRHELAANWDPGQNVTSVFGYTPAFQVLATRTMRRRAIGIYCIAQNVRRHCRHVLANMCSTFLRWASSPARPPASRNSNLK